MKPQVAAQRVMDATVLEENNHRTPTVLGHQLEDLVRAVTVLVVPAVVVVLLVMVMLLAEAAAAGAPHTGLAGEPVTKAIMEAAATQTATSPVSHAAATMLAAELKKYDARSPPRQATTTASPPSLLDFAICFSQRNSNLWGSPSTTRSKTQSSGSDAMPYPSKMLAATTTQSASTFPSVWTKHNSLDSSRSTRTRSTSGTSSRISSLATSRMLWDTRVLAWT
jgi:type IV secretory pathway TrbL component